MSQGLVLSWQEGQQWSFSNSENLGEKPPGSSSASPAAPQPAEKPGPPNSSATKGGGESDHEVHIWTERERRKKMRNMFASLHALLPQLSPKADKSTIVDEAVNYIKTLQQTLHNLQKQKLERLRSSVVFEVPLSSASMVPIQSQGLETRESFMADMGKSLMPLQSPTAISIPRFPLSFQTWNSPNVVLSITGEDAHINICAAKKPGLLSTIFYVLDKHKLEVVSAHVSSDYFRSTYMIHARANGVLDQFPETLMIEEIFKLAVGELILWVSS